MLKHRLHNTDKVYFTRAKPLEVLQRWNSHLLQCQKPCNGRFFEDCEEVKKPCDVWKSFDIIFSVIRKDCGSYYHKGHGTGDMILTTMTSRVRAIDTAIDSTAMLVSICVKLVTDMLSLFVWLAKRGQHKGKRPNSEWFPQPCSGV